MTASSRIPPSRAELWWVDFAPTLGREQSGRRPALVVSTDTYNHGPASLVVVLPVTGTDRRIPLWVRIEPPDGGVTKPCFVMADAVRSVSKERFGDRLGIVSERTMREVEDRLRIVLEL